MPELALSTPLSPPPHISVVMSVFNAAPYLGEAIESILAQTYRNFEFIIVDDGSNDDSARILHEYAGRDPRIRPLFLDHGGIGRAVNVGIEMAQGEWIARMDADDIALPHRFAIQLAWVQRTGVDVCGGAMEQFGARSGVLHMLETHDSIRTDLLFRLGFLQPTVLARAEVFKQNRYDEESVTEDYELWTRLALHYQLGNIPAVLAKYRRHAVQTHTVQQASALVDLRKYRRRYLMDLYSDATATDAHVLACVAEVKPLDSLDHLLLAGNWLVRLAHASDPLSVQAMASRWYNACRHSTHLGFGCYRLYRQISTQFTAPAHGDLSALWLASLLRLRMNSTLAQRLRWFKKEFVTSVER